MNITELAAQMAAQIKEKNANFIIQNPNAKIGNNYGFQDTTACAEIEQLSIIDFDKMRRITASAVAPLLKKGRDKTKPSEEAVKYIKRRALASCGIESESVRTKATDWGKRHEPYAILELAELYGTDILFTGDEQEYVFHPEIMLAGYADGYMEINGTKWVVEVKCPYDALVHHERSKYVTSDDVKQNDHDIFIQLQSLLMLSKYSEFGACEGIKFISFDPRRSTRRLVEVNVFHCHETQRAIKDAVNHFAPILEQEVRFIMGMGV